ncbi:MAG: heme-copper oxidase subunit III [Deltaproteobacteria bacterium]|nr:heme-copper oxidase subunit III [Deltaproteobacteria bacterium]MBT5486649.1 heme-copper oxidase subunit III [Deltaproteobacteria bacterium]MBT7809850.1 heme-copper oxidase subunit III [Deltaproteobacteria bacterium]
MTNPSSQSVLFATSEVSLTNQPKRAKPPVSSGVIGILIFMVTEAMFFAALISAYLVIRSGIEEWPPWGQPRLPIETTAFNTLVLLLSGLTMGFSRNLLQKQKFQEGRRLLGISILLGTFFMVAQGYEWVQLVNFGMTVSSSVYGGLFYLIIGAHGFHVVGVLAVLIHAWNRLGASNNSINVEGLIPLQLLWYFVVCVWPVLYVLVYLT